jgi:hypothetical protein
MSAVPLTKEKQRILESAEAAAYIGAQPQTLRAWRHRGVGPAYLKLAVKIRYKLDDLDKFIEQSRVVPSKKRKRRAA